MDELAAVQQLLGVTFNNLSLLREALIHGSFVNENSALVDARLEAEKLEEHFEIELPEGEFESVGGFVIHLLGKIPDAGEKITFEDLEMTIKSAEDRKIEKILITRLPPSSSMPEANEQP